MALKIAFEFGLGINIGIMGLRTQSSRAADSGSADFRGGFEDRLIVSSSGHMGFRCDSEIRFPNVCE